MPRRAGPGVGAPFLSATWAAAAASLDPTGQMTGALGRNSIGKSFDFWSVWKNDPRWWDMFKISVFK